MSQTVTINGVSYAFPDVDEENWGQTVTNWAVSVSTNLLQKTGGTFTLSAEVDFGASHGVKSLYFKGRTSTPAIAGIIRLAKTDSVSWRNQTDAGDVSLALGSGNMIEWAGVELVDLTSTQTMSAKTITGTFTGNLTGNVTGDLTGDVTGDITGDITGDVTGNASTATALQTARTIGGTSFDGTGNIAVALASAATALQTARTIGGTSFDGTSNIAVALASEATALETARTIGGTSFDGTANIAVALATAATALETARTISMTGDVTWSSGSFDGSGNVTAAATLAATQANVTSAANLTTVGALANGSIASGFGAIDNGTSGIKSNVVTATTNIELDHQGSDPAAPGGANDVILYAKTKKVYTRDGAGTVTELGAGGGAGDADTIQLKTAEASEGTGSAPWYTGNNPVPGGGGSIGGTWELSTSNPLINTNDATKVFHYSNATSNRKGDYFEIELDVPNYAKGHNLVVQLFYRTVGAEDTDFLFFARDRTGDYSTTTTSTGAQTTITLASATGFAVGDRICLQDSSEDRHFRYVTVVDGSDITFSGSAITFASGDAVVSKFFTDELNFITAENNTTNYEGKIRKWAFQINDTTTKIRVGFLYDNSATSTNELFFDQILLSSNQFLQTSSQGQTEEYMSNGWGGTVNYRLYGGTERINTLNELGSIRLGDSSNSWRYTSTAKQKVNMTLTAGLNGGGAYLAILKGTTAQVGTSTTSASDASYAAYRMAVAEITNGDIDEISASFVVEKDEIIELAVSNNTNGPHTGATNASVHLTATPLVNDVILLNSQSEIFTDWTAYTPTWENSPTITNQQAWWRRNGPNLEIKGRMQMGSAPADTMALSLPSGLSIDVSKIGGEGADDVYFPSRFLRATNTVKYNDAGSNSSGLFFDKSQSIRTTYLFVGSNYNGQSGNCIDNTNYNSFGGSGDGIEFYAHGIPIAGWTSTFNPVLSMPLVDFGTFENTYTAIIDADQTTPVITSQNGNAILSVARNGTGIVDVTFTSGFFGVTPAVTAEAIAAGAGFATNTDVLTASTVKVRTYDTKTYAGSNQSFSLTLSRQGSDYRQPPQPTAAVIKPAVALLQDVQPSNTASGKAFQDAWGTRVLNTIKGESWFVTLSSNAFTLEPGMYEILATAPFYMCENIQLRLYDVTNSIATDYGQVQYARSANYDSVTTNLDAVKTITSSTQYRLEYRVGLDSDTNGLGAGEQAWGGVMVFAQVLIRKLK